MTHFGGLQTQELLSTATFIVNNPSEFIDNVVVWSQSYINGGIANSTYSEIIARAGVSAIVTVGDSNVTQTTVTQEADGQERLQNMQLEELGMGLEELSLALGSTQQQLQIAINENREFISEVNLRLSGQVENLGTSVTDASNAASGGGITSLFAGIGIGGLVALAAVAFFVLKGKGIL